MKKLLIAMTATVLLVPSVYANNFKDTEHAIDYRKSAFGLIAYNFGDMGAMLKGKKDFDAAVFASRATNVAALSKIPHEGFITGSNGKKADCRNSILILTSHLGAADAEQNAIGFGRSQEKEGTDDEAAKKFFKPEFRNRLDGVIKFSKLDKISMKKIVAKFVNELNDLLSEKGLRIIASENMTDHLVDVGFDPAMGARPLSRKINELIKVPLSKKILFENIEIGSRINVDYLDGEIRFDIVPPKPMELLESKTVDDNGIIIVK